MKPGDAIEADRTAPRPRRYDDLSPMEQSNCRRFKAQTFDVCNDCGDGGSDVHFTLGTEIICPAEEEDVANSRD